MSGVLGQAGTVGQPAWALDEIEKRKAELKRIEATALRFRDEGPDAVTLRREEFIGRVREIVRSTTTADSALLALGQLRELIRSHDLALDTLKRYEELRRSIHEFEERTATP